jgi:hypothetical protein
VQGPCVYEIPESRDERNTNPGNRWFYLLPSSLDGLILSIFRGASRGYRSEPSG